MRFIPAALAISLAIILPSAPALARADAPASAVAPRPLDNDAAQRGRAMLTRAIDWLRAQQHAPTGGWGIPEQPDAPHFPAITALVINGMLLNPTITRDDPAVARGIAYLLTKQQPDGGIYDRALASYNTSIAISALARAGGEPAQAAVEKAVGFLRTLQWGEAAREGDPETGKVGPEHAFYGGVGYGRSGRPDSSNLHFFMQALEDAGVDCKDPAVTRAVAFLQRTQMLDEVNDMPYAEGSRQGGFIYATSPDKDNIGAGESKAGEVEETMSDGTVRSRLRAYGSMTYAGFKSYLYAQLPADDVRVSAAFEWIRRNYTLEENPGVGTDGLYYYFVTFSRALDSLGRPVIEPIAPVGAGTPDPRDWRRDLVDRLAALQNSDGSFRSVDDRWMENNPVLITAYSVIALGHALGD